MCKNRILPIILAISFLVACSTASTKGSGHSQVFSDPDDMSSQDLSPEALADTFGAVYSHSESKPQIFSGTNYSFMDVPEKAVTLYYYGGANTWKAIAGETGYSEETLRAINPYVVEQEDGTLIADPNYSADETPGILLDPNYQLPDTACQELRIDLPNVTDGTDNGSKFIIPADLDDRAAVTFAESLEFLYHTTYNTYYKPDEALDENSNMPPHYALPGARFTTMTDFRSYLSSIITPEFASYYIDPQTIEGYTYNPRYYAGDNDTFCMSPGGAMGPSYSIMGATYTEPQVQSDGKIVFAMLVLGATEKRQEYINGSIDAAEALDTAHYIPICMIPDEEGGWRVDVFSFVGGPKLL